MGGKGGGAWKVAYADFVTAMMAFFLVMWICGQDQAMRKAVAHYFQDPLSSSVAGNSSNPSRSGSLADSLNYGSVPKQESVSMGKGRRSHTPGKEKGPATKIVADEVVGDEKSRAYWERQARAAKEWAATSPDVQAKLTTAERAAVHYLAQKLRHEITTKSTAGLKGLQQEMVFESMAQVNWTELAEDLLAS